MINPRPQELLTNLLRFAAGTPGAAVGAHGWLALRGEDATAMEAVGPALARNLRRGEAGKQPTEDGKKVGKHEDL